MSSSPDLCIIGAGALGVELALHARRLGGSVVLVDRGRPEPGDSVAAQLRRAAIRESARRVQQMRRAPELGIGVSEFKLSVKQVAERAQRFADERGRATAREILTARGITVVVGEAAFADTRTVLAGDTAIVARRTIIAVGGEALVPDVPGLVDTPFFTIDTIVENQRKLTHLVILGRDAAAVEEAQVQRRLGAEVTLVPGGEVLAGFDRETTSLLLRELGAEGVRIMEGWTVAAVRARSQGIGVEIRQGEDIQTLDASHILVSAGREADLDALDYSKSGAKAGGGRLAGLTTGRSRVALAGAAASEESWAEALAHGRALVEEALGVKPARAPAIPHVVQTEPGLAELRPGIPGTGPTILRENLAENDQAASIGLSAGLLKIWLGPGGKVARASIVAPQAAELAAALSLATQTGQGVEALARLPLPQPSLMSILSRLGENHIAAQSVSLGGARRWDLNRLLRR